MLPALARRHLPEHIVIWPRASACMDETSNEAALAGQGQLQLFHVK